MDWLDTRPSPAAVATTFALATVADEAAVKVSVSLFVLAPEAVAIGLADHAAVTPAGSPVTENEMFPLNDPPVAAVKLNVLDPPCTTATDVAASVKLSVGVSATVREYVKFPVPEPSVPVSVIDCAPADAVDPTVIVTVEDVPGVIDAGLKLTVTPDGAFAVKATAFFPAPLSVTFSVKLAVLPTCTVPLVDERELRTKSEPAFVPRPTR